MENLKFRSAFLQYIILTFLIAWVSEFIMIGVEKSNLLSETAVIIVVKLLTILGAGLAPAYAAFIVLYKANIIYSFSDFMKRCFMRNVGRKSILITVIFGIAMLFPYIIFGEYVGYSWYILLLLPLILAVMILGGGLEEIGWRGFLQPLLESKLSCIPATFLIGITRSIWHLPLWLVSNAAQSSYNFLLFSIMCMSKAFIFAALYKLTKSTCTCILLHAWSNCIDGMFLSNALASWNTVTVIIWIAEIVISIIICGVFNKRNQSISNSLLFSEGK
jgi:membrane protease YdiL (CAAX protease family)